MSEPTNDEEPPRVWAQRLEDALAGIGLGNVSGPISSTIRRAARWAGVGGTEVSDSVLEVTNAGSFVLPALQTIDGRDLSVDGAAQDAHIASTSNPHSDDASDVGLGNVSNDAQLTRGAGDWAGFSGKTPIGADEFLIEDSADSSAKKRATATALIAAAAAADNLIETAIARVTTNITHPNTTAFVDVTGASYTFTASAGEVLSVKFACCCGFGSDSPRFQLMLDGVAADSGARPVASSSVGSILLTYRWTGLSAGSHTVKVQWRMSVGGVSAASIQAASSPLTAHGAILVKRTRT